MYVINGNHAKLEIASQILYAEVGQGNSTARVFIVRALIRLAYSRYRYPRVKYHDENVRTDYLLDNLRISNVSTLSDGLHIHQIS